MILLVDEKLEKQNNFDSCYSIVLKGPICQHFE